MRIEVGYGLEGAIPDGLEEMIRDNSLVPHLRNDDYGTGFLRSTEAIFGVIAKEYGVELPNVSLAETNKYSQYSGSSLPRIPIRLIGTWEVKVFAGVDACLDWVLVTLDEHTFLVLLKVRDLSVAKQLAHILEEEIPPDALLFTMNRVSETDE